MFFYFFVRSISSFIYSKWLVLPDNYTLFFCSGWLNQLLVSYIHDIHHRYQNIQSYIFYSHVFREWSRSRVKRGLCLHESYSLNCKTAFERKHVHLFESRISPFRRSIRRSGQSILLAACSDCLSGHGIWWIPVGTRPL